MWCAWCTVYAYDACVCMSCMVYMISDVSVWSGCIWYVSVCRWCVWYASVWLCVYDMCPCGWVYMMCVSVIRVYTISTYVVRVCMIYVSEIGYICVSVFGSVYDMFLCGWGCIWYVSVCGWCIRYVALFLGCVWYVSVWLRCILYGSICGWCRGK